jgi:electron transfer flavoprotein alpha/beta subunit
MSENSSDPAYLAKKFKEAQDRYRLTGVGGLLETDKDKDIEPVDPKGVENAMRNFRKGKGNVVTMGNTKLTKATRESSSRVLGIHKPTQGEK